MKEADVVRWQLLEMKEERERCLNKVEYLNREIERARMRMDGMIKVNKRMVKA